MAIRPDILGDASISGTGTGFIVKDSASGLLRPLQAAELATTLITGAATPTVNYGLSATAASSGRTVANSLTLNSGGGVAQLAGLSNVAPSGLPVSTVVNSGGILAFTGNTGITTGRLETQNNAAFQFRTQANLDVSSVLFGTTGGLTKGEAGTLTLGGRNLYTGQTHVNAGTLKLAGGENTLPVLITAGVPTLTALGINEPGAIVDLNGNNQIVGTIVNNAAGRYAGSGGTITNTSATQATLTGLAGSAQVFAAILAGNLSFNRTGNNALTFTNVNTLCGSHEPAGEHHDAP